MIDSAAHTFLTDVGKYQTWSIQMWEDYLDEYTQWLWDNFDYIESAVELDIDYIVGPLIVEKWQKQYFQPLVEAGMDICFVWHEQRGLDGWEEMCSKRSYVGLPGVFSKNADFNKFITIARKYTTKIHGFAASVVGDSRILVRNNFNGEKEYVAIADFFDKSQPDKITGIDEWRKSEGYSVWTLNDDFRPEFKPVSRVVKHILDKKIYRVTLRGGKCLECTGDHSLFALTRDGKLLEVRPEDLKVGDCLVSSLGLPQLVESKQLDVKDAEFYGYWFGDGHVDKKMYHVGCSKQHQPEIRKICEDYARRHGGTLSPISKGTVDAWISSKQISVKLVRMFGRVGKNKHLNELFNWSLQSQAAFLRGYYSADGSAKGDNHNISLSCYRKDILEVVQLLLEQWDIRSAMTDAGKTGKGGHTWKLDISDGVSRENFSRYIGFIQQEQTDEIKLKQGGGNIGKYRGLPVELLQTPGRYNTPLRQNRVVGKIKRASLDNNNFVPCLENMCAQYQEIAHIEVVSEGGIPVYDLEVPSVQRFFANGILAHNTKQTDFRDWPWFSVDSTTWKSAEEWGTLPYWDSKRQRFRYLKKEDRPKIRQELLDHGFDADAIIADSDYKEVTRCALWGLVRMEDFYADRYSDRTFYYELRLPHPKALQNIPVLGLRKFWRKFSPEKTFKDHASATSPRDIFIYLYAIACVQYGELNLLGQEHMNFLQVYFQKHLESNQIDHTILAKELALVTTPTNPLSLERIEPEHWIPHHVPKQRETSLADSIEYDEYPEYMTEPFQLEELL